jgi:predicted short-subunit dehydrogenase-like oxidoreductase (DUF2520 family)
MMGDIKTINIIGSGNMAYVLYTLLKDKVRIESVFMRSEKNRPLFKGAKIVNTISQISENVDLNIICVTDDSIMEVSTHLSENIPAVHTSGTVPLSVLSSQKAFGVLYPFQTVSKNRQIDFEKVPLFIEGNTQAFETSLLKFCRANLSQNTTVLSSEKREKIHLAGVFANNFTTLMIGYAVEILEDNQLPASLLEPLLLETVYKTLSDGYSSAQTGPARRGDQTTIQKHLNLLKAEDQIRIYKLMSEIITSKFKI